MVNIFPGLDTFSNMFHDKDVFMRQIQEKAGDRPVVGHQFDFGILCQETMPQALEINSQAAAVQH